MRKKLKAIWEMLNAPAIEYEHKKMGRVVRKFKITVLRVIIVMMTIVSAMIIYRLT